MRAIVLIPTYNERANLAELVQKIRQVAPALHMLVVDDNSPDGTGQLADELARQDPERLFVLHRQKKEGLGKAYVAAFTQVLKKDYEYIPQMDADEERKVFPDLAGPARPLIRPCRPANCRRR